MLKRKLIIFLLILAAGLLLAACESQPETIEMTVSPTYTEVNATSTSLQFNTYSVGGELIDSHTIFKGV